MPIGTPAAIPASATVVACQQTAAATWRRTKPSTFSSPVSLRRLATLTSSRCTNVAAPKSESMTPNSSGKFTDSPKLTSTVGLAGRWVRLRYRWMCRANAALPAGPGTARTSTTAAMPCLAARWQVDWPRPGGHCAPMKALAVITAPLPSPPVPAFRDARPITWNQASCGTPTGSETVTRTVPPSREPVARIVATLSMMSRSPWGRRPSTADSRAGPSPPAARPGHAPARAGSR
jgi:hypothetical protein